MLLLVICFEPAICTMDNRDQLLKQLLEKLDLLTQRQAAFSDEINELRQAVADLEASGAVIDESEV